MKETEGLINQGLTSTPEKEYQNLSQGTDTSGLLTQPDNFNQGLSFGDQALSSAIRGKYSRPFQLEQSGLQNKMKLDARNEHFQKILTAHKMASEEAAMNFQKELLKYKQKQAKKAQRGQIVGQVLGLVGGVVGGVYGGAGGAAGGMAAGNMVGNSAGGGGPMVER